MEHIHRTPGFKQGNWPHEMTLDQNLADLIRHDKDFQTRRGFTYTVLDPDDDVVGCVYIYPLAADPSAANVSSWVTEATGRPRCPAVSRGVRVAGARLAVPARRVRSTGRRDQSAGLRARLGATRGGSFGIFG